MTTATEEAQRRAEASRDIFGERLRWFVERWKPDDVFEVHDFQMDLTRLMVEAMSHKSDCLSYGINFYAEMRFAELAMQPLHIIVEKPKR